jgi:hypothetical protein
MLTVWRIHVGDVGIVRGSSCPDVHSRGAAYGHSTVMSTEEGALIKKVALKMGHVRERAQVKVLVISQDEDDVRLITALVGSTSAMQDILIIR